MQQIELQLFLRTWVYWCHDSYRQQGLSGSGLNINELKWCWLKASTLEPSSTLLSYLCYNSTINVKCSLFIFYPYGSPLSLGIGLAMEFALANGILAEVNQAEPWNEFVELRLSLYAPVFYLKKNKLSGAAYLRTIRHELHSQPDHLSGSDDVVDPHMHEQKYRWLF